MDQHHHDDESEIAVDEMPHHMGHHDVVVGLDDTHGHLPHRDHLLHSIKRTYADIEDEPSKRQRRSATTPQKKLNEDQWAEMFARLVKYKEHHGDCLVPKRYTEDPKLGTWVETQRVQYKKLQQPGEPPNNRLNPERLAKLESVGFAWSAKNVRKPKQPSPAAPSAKKRVVDNSPISACPSSRAQTRQRISDQVWNEMYLRLATYKEKYGDCLVPKKFEEDLKLSSWVEAQRVLYNRDFKSKPTTSPLPEPNLVVEAKSPEEWAVEMDRVNGATEEDAAEVAATMAEATMEVVNDVVAEGGDQINKVKRLSEDRKQKLDALGFVWSLRSKRVDDHWDTMFRQLEEYKERYGDCLVPSRFEENYKLGKWVETQRYEYTKLQRANNVMTKGEAEGLERKVAHPRLTEARRARLESIGFEWKVKHKMRRYYDRQWDIMFDKLLQFKAATGHCMVPKRYPPDVKLGTWIHTQRIQYRKMMAATKKEESCKSDDSKRDDDLSSEENFESKAEETPKTAEDKTEEQFFRLTDARRRRLESIGFIWSARDSEKNPAEPSRISRNSYDDQWDAMFLRLQAYQEKHGHCLVPKRCQEDPKLGTWVDTQRVQYKKMRKKLEQQGVEYVAPAATSSDIMASGSDLSARKPLVGRLTDDRIRRLEGLGFVWSLRDDWKKHYEELKEYKSEFGNCNVPARYSKNRRLGIWVSAQRQQYKQIQLSDSSKPRRSAPLTQERIDLLNDLGFTWTIRSRDSLGESWNQRLEELKQYKDKYGNCLVPSRFMENPELGIWVGTQRTQYRLYQQAKQTGERILYSTAMNEDRIEQLEELGFVWALRSGTDMKWRRQINDLASFRAHHGHSSVPSNYKGNPKLGEWASETREAYMMRNNGAITPLDDEKVAELDQLEFSWIEPTQEEADAINNEVTIVTTDEGSTLGNMVFEVSHHTDHTDHDHISVSVTGMADAATTASLIQEAITHAEI